MTDEFTGILCQSLSECQAVLRDLEDGSICSEVALQRLKEELSRQELLRAMWEVGAFPGTPPPHLLANH